MSTNEIRLLLTPETVLSVCSLMLNSISHVSTDGQLVFVFQNLFRVFFRLNLQVRQALVPELLAHIQEMQVHYEEQLKSSSGPSTDSRLLEIMDVVSSVLSESALVGEDSNASIFSSRPSKSVLKGDEANGVVYDCRNWVSNSAVISIKTSNQGAAEITFRKTIGVVRWLVHLSTDNTMRMTLNSTAAAFADMPMSPHSAFSRKSTAKNLNDEDSFGNRFTSQNKKKKKSSHLMKRRSSLSKQQHPSQIIIDEYSGSETELMTDFIDTKVSTSDLLGFDMQDEGLSNSNPEDGGFGPEIRDNRNSPITNPMVIPTPRDAKSGFSSRSPTLNSTSNSPRKMKIGTPTSDGEMNSNVHNGNDDSMFLMGRTTPGVNNLSIAPIGSLRPVGSSESVNTTPLIAQTGTRKEFSSTAGSNNTDEPTSTRKSPRIIIKKHRNPLLRKVEVSPDRYQRNLQKFLTNMQRVEKKLKKIEASKSSRQSRVFKRRGLPNVLLSDIKNKKLSNKTSPSRVIPDFDDMKRRMGVIEKPKNEPLDEKDHLGVASDDEEEYSSSGESYTGSWSDDEDTNEDVQRLNSLLSDPHHEASAFGLESKKKLERKQQQQKQQQQQQQERRRRKNSMSRSLFQENKSSNDSHTNFNEPRRSMTAIANHHQRFRSSTPQQPMKSSAFKSRINHPKTLGDIMDWEKDISMGRMTMDKREDKMGLAWDSPTQKPQRTLTSSSSFRLKQQQQLPRKSSKSSMDSIPESPNHTERTLTMASVNFNTLAPIHLKSGSSNPIYESSHSGGSIYSAFKKYNSNNHENASISSQTQTTPLVKSPQRSIPSPSRTIHELSSTTTNNNNNNTERQGILTSTTPIKKTSPVMEAIAENMGRTSPSVNKRKGRPSPAQFGNLEGQDMVVPSNSSEEDLDEKKELTPTSLETFSLAGDEESPLLPVNLEESESGTSNNKKTSPPVAPIGVSQSQSPNRQLSEYTNRALAAKIKRAQHNRSSSFSDTGHMLRNSSSTSTTGVYIPPGTIQARQRRLRSQSSSHFPGFEKELNERGHTPRPLLGNAFPHRALPSPRHSSRPEISFVRSASPVPKQSESSSTKPNHPTSMNQVSTKPPIAPSQSTPAFQIQSQTPPASPHCGRGNRNQAYGSNYPSQPELHGNESSNKSSSDSLNSKNGNTQDLNETHDDLRFSPSPSRPPRPALFVRPAPLETSMQQFHVSACQSALLKGSPRNQLPGENLKLPKRSRSSSPTPDTTSKVPPSVITRSPPPARTASALPSSYSSASLFSKNGVPKTPRRVRGDFLQHLVNSPRLKVKTTPFELKRTAPCSPLRIPPRANPLFSNSSKPHDNLSHIVSEADLSMFNGNNNHVHNVGSSIELSNGGLKGVSSFLTTTTTGTTNSAISTSFGSGHHQRHGSDLGLALETEESGYTPTVAATPRIATLSSEAMIQKRVFSVNDLQRYNPIESPDMKPITTSPHIGPTLKPVFSNLGSMKVSPITTSANLNQAPQDSLLVFKQHSNDNKTSEPDCTIHPETPDLPFATTPINTKYNHSSNFLPASSANLRGGSGITIGLMRNTSGVDGDDDDDDDDDVIIEEEEKTTNSMTIDVLKEGDNSLFKGDSNVDVDDSSAVDSTVWSPPKPKRKFSTLKKASTALPQVCNFKHKFL
eukprot:TRINITY_DN905_c0_g3_i2.p1 TRINITY_DN905_c0_g3~~TRINITY_DN905_c0_g3_i2.p1  ORF type:complete len:1701 (-),score=530.85 TRINITY_DN905_c0_g3_i2:214-5166(-)